MADEEKLDPVQVLAVRGTPWEPVPGMQGMEVTSNVVIPGEDDPIPKQVRGEEREVVLRNEHISKKDIFSIIQEGLRTICNQVDTLT